jgi:hypothetical protein
MLYTYSLPNFEKNGGPCASRLPIKVAADPTVPVFCEVGIDTGVDYSDFKFGAYIHNTTTEWKIEIFYLRVL